MACHPLLCQVHEMSHEEVMYLVLHYKKITQRMFLKECARAYLLAQVRLSLELNQYIYAYVVNVLLDVSTLQEFKVCDQHKTHISINNLIQCPQISYISKPKHNYLINFNIIKYQQEEKEITIKSLLVFFVTLQLNTDEISMFKLSFFFHLITSQNSYFLLMGRATKTSLSNNWLN